MREELINIFGVRCGLNIEQTRVLRPMADPGHCIGSVRLASVAQLIMLIYVRLALDY